MTKFLIKYEKCGYSLYVDGELVSSYSRLGIERAKQQVIVMQKVLENLNIKTECHIDIDNYLNRRVYPNRR